MAKAPTTVETEGAVAGESKSDAFKRIAARRVNKVLDAISVLENTFNKNNYEYTDEQVEAIFVAIAGQVDKARKRANGDAPSKTGFAL